MKAAEVADGVGVDVEKGSEGDRDAGGGQQGLATRDDDRKGIRGYQRDGREAQRQ